MTVDVRRFLGISWVYRAFQSVAGGKGRSIYVHEYLQPRPGMRVLDIGCGPGNILNHLDKSVDYTGVDLSSAYILHAKRNFGTRGRFLNESVSNLVVRESNSFDLVMANGLIHHLDDPDARSLLHIAKNALKPDGRFVSLDGCFAEGQSRLARLIVSCDRGQFVRTLQQYIELAKQYFPTVQYHVRHDLTTLPYTHLIMSCSPQPTHAAVICI